MRSEVSLDAACRLIVDCPHKTAPESGEGHAFAVGTKAVLGGRIDFRKARPVDRATYESWIARAKPEPGDLILCREAPVGPVAQVPLRPRVCLGQRTVLLRPDPVVVDPQYLKYALLSPTSQAELRTLSEGSTVPHLNVADVRRFRIALPGVLEQRRIGAIIAELDGKIDSNRRLAALLEELAAAEFRGRFIDRLRAAQPTHSSSSASTGGRLSDVAEPVRKAVQPLASPTEAFEHFSIPAFDSGDGPQFTSGAEILSGKTALPGEGAVLLSRLNPATKRVWWARPSPGARPVCSPEFLALKPRPHTATSYLYALGLADDGFYDDLLSRVTGTTGSRQRVRPAEAMDCRVAVPTREAMAEWDAFARPLYDQAHAARVECRTLAELRDTLLPKLISGEIRVPDTADPEEVIGPVVEEQQQATS